jgi:hypothetical protein
MISGIAGIAADCRIDRAPIPSAMTAKTAARLRTF